MELLSLWLLAALKGSFVSAPVELIAVRQKDGFSNGTLSRLKERGLTVSFFLSSSLSNDICAVSS